MTLQKLYETLVCETFDYAAAYDDYPLHDIVSKLDIDDFSDINEIRIQLALHGSGINLPEKADFKKFGEDYLIQSMLFIVKNLEDSDLFDNFLTTIVKYKTTKQLITDKFKNICYDIYYDNIMSNHDICRTLSLFFVTYCRNSDFYPKFVRLARTFGLVSFAIKFSDLNTDKE